MTKYSLRARMMILILAPTLLIGLLLSTFFVVHRYNELQEQLVDAGASIIEPLAVASEYGMTFRSRESVRQLVSLLHRRHSDIVRSITVFDAQNNLFVTSNYHHNFAQLQLPKGVPLPTELMLTRRGDSLILRTPILSESQYPDETADGGSHPDNNPGYVAIELICSLVRLQQYKEVFVSTLLLLLCMCIAILFAYRLMRDVTGPIRNMVNTVDRIRRGQLDSRVEGYMLGELHMLKNGINSMAMSLTAYHEEMQQNIDQATSDLRETPRADGDPERRAGSGEKTRAGGGAHQVRIPRQHVARAAYSAQRRDRLHPPDAENRSERDPDRLFADHRTLGQQPADHHQRRAGLLQAGSRQAGAGAYSFCPA